MFTPTIDVDSLKHTLIAYLESENHSELARIIEYSDIDYNPQYEFSGVISYQKNLHVVVRIPIAFKRTVENQVAILNKFIFEIYRNDDAYMLTKVVLGIKAIQLEDFNVQEKSIIVERDSVYSTCIQRLISDNKLTSLHKSYLYESCNVGSNGNMMAATMMLGCAAEIALIELVNATYKFYEKNKTETESSNYELKVLKAKTAYARIEELLKRLRIEKKALQSLGIENIESFFSIFEIIRITRNDVGHPTGNILTKEKFEVQLSAYMSILNQYQKLIDGLPQVEDN